MEIEKLLNKYPYEVSGGQKAKGSSARAIITNPELILADEQQEQLDSKATDSLLRLFNRINEDGQTILNGDTQHKGCQVMPTGCFS